MNDFLKLFAEHPLTTWLGVGAILLTGEILTQTTYLLLLAAAAAIIALITGFFPHLALTSQFLIFSLTSIILVFLGRKFSPIGNHGTENLGKLNEPHNRLVGQSALVLEDFHGGIGAISLGDTRWRALCQSCNPKAGEFVDIEKVEGATVFVKPKA